ncbi:MAG: pyrroline-5-carboxylate reductase, partial [Clostridia bacterium]|nr:pyrroline-5-carboxylate reductase [Clostridia bacterium]
MNIGFIGAGNMAGAMIRGLRSHGFSADEVAAYDIDTAKLQALSDDCGMTMVGSPDALIRRSDVVVLAVKPQMLTSALATLPAVFAEKRPLVISIVAGTTLDTLGQLCGEGLRIIRVMPNLNATVGESMSAYCGNAAVTEADKQITETILASFGTFTPLPEDQFAAFLGLASSSPAFTMLYMDALIKVGEAHGIPHDTATAVVAQAVLGTAKLLAESGDSTEVWIDRVCSPGGTTIEGIKSLRADNVSDAVGRAAEASIRRDMSCSKNNHPRLVGSGRDFHEDHHRLG